MALRSIRRVLTLTLLAVGVVLVGLFHIAFGLANFQPGFPKLEGIAALLAGAATLASVSLARRSIRRALLTVFLGTLPLVAWFAYAVPITGSSDARFFWASLVVPTAAGLAVMFLRRRGVGGAGAEGQGR